MVCFAVFSVLVVVGLHLEPLQSLFYECWDSELQLRPCVSETSPYSLHPMSQMALKSLGSQGGLEFFIYLFLTFWDNRCVLSYLALVLSVCLSVGFEAGSLLSDSGCPRIHYVDLPQTHSHLPATALVLDWRHGYPTQQVLCFQIGEDSISPLALSSLALSLVSF